MNLGSSYSPLNFCARVKLGKCNEEKLLKSVSGVASSASGVASAGFATVGSDAVIGNEALLDSIYGPRSQALYRDIHQSYIVPPEGGAFKSDPVISEGVFLTGSSAIGSSVAALDAYAASSVNGNGKSSSENPIEDDNIPD